MASNGKLGKAVEEYLKAKRASEEAESNLEVAKALLKSAMGDNEESSYNGVKVSYKAPMSVSEPEVKRLNRYAWEQCSELKLNVKLLRERFPEVADSCLVAGSKRLSVSV